MLTLTCHRQFIIDHMEEHKLSMRDFVAKVNGVTSVSALSHFLKKNSRGDFCGSYSFRLDTWLEILEHLDLNPVEYDHLFLLKIEDDVNLKFHPKSGQSNAIRRIIQTRGRRLQAVPTSMNFTQKALSMAKIFDALPDALKEELSREAERLSGYFIRGQKRSSRIAGMKTHLENLLN